MKEENQKKLPLESTGYGMSSLTVKTAIRHDLRRQLIREYNVIGLNNRGRYYDAAVQSKDGRWAIQLLIDKQNGNVQVISKKEKK